MSTAVDIEFEFYVHLVSGAGCRTKELACRSRSAQVIRLCTPFAQIAGENEVLWIHGNGTPASKHFIATRKATTSLCISRGSVVFGPLPCRMSRRTEQQNNRLAGTA